MSVTMMSRLVFNLRQWVSLSKNNYDTTLPTSALHFQPRRPMPSGGTDDEFETLPIVRYDGQPPEFADRASTTRAWAEGDLELKPLPAIEEVPRNNAITKVRF